MSSVFEKTGQVSVSAEFAPVIFTPLWFLCLFNTLRSSGIGLSLEQQTHFTHLLPGHLYLDGSHLRLSMSPPHVTAFPKAEPLPAFLPLFP